MTIFYIEYKNKKRNLNPQNLYKILKKIFIVIFKIQNIIMKKE